MSQLQDGKTPPTDPADTSDEGVKNIDKAMAYAAYFESIQLMRSERQRKQAVTRFFNALTGQLQGKLGGAGVLVLCIALASVLMSVAGVDPELGRLYDALGRWLGECPTVTVNAPAPASLPLPLPVSPHGVQPTP